jgi:hypothetical protein
MRNAKPIDNVVSLDNVISEEKLPALRADLNRLEGQRKCMRIPDRYWRAMKSRARKSHEPIVTALERELARHANVLIEAF